MGRKVEVCEECTQKCLLFHGREKSSSHVPTSFFKVMVGDDFSRVLYLPPKFRPTVSALVHKKTILKDSSGQKWKVTVSIVDSTFAFEEGWNAFSLEHGLQVGDFLVFNYISELHFDVKIYDRSGCEKLDFSKNRNQKKRSRERNGSPARDGKLVRQGRNASVISKPDVPKMKSQHGGVDLGGTQNNVENISIHDDDNGRAQSMCKAEHGEDPCYMTGRDYGDKERDDRSSMFDVLDFEIWNNSSVNGTGKIATRDSKVSHVYGPHVSQNDASKCNKDPLFEGILGSGAASDASEYELSRRNNSLQETDESASDKTTTLKLEENRENNSNMSNREVQECQFDEGSESDQAVISKKVHALHIGSFQNTEQMFNGIPNLLDARIHHGEMSKMIKKELVDMTPNLCSYKDKLHVTGEMSKMIKKELVDMTPNVCSSKDKLQAAGSSKVIKGEWGQSSHMINQDSGSILNAVNAEPSDFESPYQTAATVSCVVPTDNDRFLVLPTFLPLSHRGRVKMERMVVLLRDPLRRLWPVLYHEQSSFKILTSGWIDFHRANNVQPADVCIFGVENESERIFAVDIVHN